MDERVDISIYSAFDAITARAKVREFARETGLDITGQARISLAAYSLANVPGPGGKSRNQLIVTGVKKGKRAGVQVVCIIPDAVGNHFASEAFENVRWMVDEFNMEALPSNEVQVALVQWSLPPKGRFQ
jgi:hypothetical protein